MTYHTFVKRCFHLKAGILEALETDTDPWSVSASHEWVAYVIWFNMVTNLSEWPNIVKRFLIMQQANYYFWSLIYKTIMGPIKVWLANYDIIGELI